MADISKTAKAAMKAGVSKDKKDERSDERAIAELRANRAAGLHVSPTDVDILFVEYDKLNVAHMVASIQLHEAIQEREALRKTLAEKQAILDSFVTGAADMQAQLSQVTVAQTTEGQATMPLDLGKDIPGLV